MEHALVGLAHVAAWTFLVVFLFAIIGVIATIRWIIGLFHRTENAVESGVESVEHAVTRR